MLNLFSYGEDEEDSKSDFKLICSGNITFRESIPSNVKEVKDESGSVSSSAPTSLFAAVPEVKKSKKTIKNKQKKLLDIAKFAKVPVEELMKEFQNEPKTSETTKKTSVSSLSFLPAPKHSSNISSKEKEVVDERKEVTFDFDRRIAVTLVQRFAF